MTIPQMTLTEEICTAISGALHDGATGVAIGDKFYEFQGDTYKYLDIRNSRGKLFRFQKQNPAKQSSYGRLARSGARVTWGINNDGYKWIRIVNGIVNDLQP